MAEGDDKRQLKHDPGSIWEVRRNSPGHYWAKAINSRFTAYLLSIQTKGAMTEAAASLGYGGDPTIAVHEAFIREAATCIELRIKSTIAERIEAGQGHVKTVPMDHKLDELWQKAGLERLPDADHLRLLKLREVLYWRGKYGAPVNDQAVERERSAREPYEYVEEIELGLSSTLKLRRPISLDFDDVDRIFTAACAR